MEQLLNRRGLSVNGLFDFSHLEPSVCEHLRRVYACLSLGLLAAAAGAWASAALLPLYGLGGCLLSVGLLMYLLFTRDDFGAGRHAAFAAFCGLAGAGLSPLLGLAVDIDPGIVASAVVVTLVVSVSFTLAVLLSRRSRCLLFLAGPLMSGLWLLLGLQLANLLLRSDLVLGLSLKLSLVVFSLFLLYDTQKIVELARAGDKDYILHCVDLFLDVVELFRVVLLLFMRQQQGQQDGERKRRRKD